ncbi:MAG: serine/threonine-protein kinase, partial [Chloroflexota bacterium]
MSFPPIVDRYKLLGEIGRGGMGRVFKARDLQLKRDVAVKFLNVAQLNNEVAHKRFEREVRTLATNPHTSIVPLYDYGGLSRTNSDQPPFIVMRLMDQSLKEVILRGASMNLDAAIYILERIGSALDFLHKNQIVHRDLKPQNIFLDSENYPYLGDFGIAHESAGQTLTSSELIGTPHYMSPEQIRSKPLDGRSDIYSLGCIMFELLTGFR